MLVELVSAVALDGVSDAAVQGSALSGEEASVDGVASECVSEGEAICRFFHEDLHVDQLFDHAKKIIFFQPGKSL